MTLVLFSVLNIYILNILHVTQVGVNPDEVEKIEREGIPGIENEVNDSGDAPNKGKQASKPLLNSYEDDADMEGISFDKEKIKKKKKKKKRRAHNRFHEVVLPLMKEYSNLSMGLHNED